MTYSTRARLEYKVCGCYDSLMEPWIHNSPLYDTSPQQNSLWHCFLFSAPRFRIPFQTVDERTISSFLNYLYGSSQAYYTLMVFGQDSRIWRWRICGVAGRTQVCVTSLLPWRCQSSSQSSSQLFDVLSLMSFVVSWQKQQLVWEVLRFLLTKASQRVHPI